MFSTKEIPSPSSMFSAYSYIPASFRSIRSCFSSTFRYVFKRGSPQLTLVVDELNAMTGYQNQIPGGMMGNQMPMPMPMPGGMMRNQIYDASELYLSTKISPDTKRLQISKTPKDKNLTIRLENEEKIVDVYNGIKLKWRFVCVDPETKPPFPKPVKKSFELSFHQKHKDFVLNTYLPFLLDRAEAIKDEQRVLRMFTLNNFVSNWKSIDLENPSNFETLAMEPDLKNAVMEDLNRFVKRKELYKGAGKAWKRGYLLYGPPRSGKSSLVVAMANYLKFDVYALQLANIKRESDLRRLLLSTRNRSILVIEDTDCRVDLHDPGHDEDSDEFSDDFDDDDLPVKGPVAGGKQPQPDVKLTLSGVLNFIDGLWSSCGDERIIIFTTNHKDRLDPALLRPGRTDMHIHMSYCTAQGFKLLASNYLDIKGHHRLLGEIEGLLQNTEVTHAQIAEELMKSEDADIALEGLVKLLKRKKLEADEAANKAESRKQA